ncbi:hypothetical protein GFS60_07418 (plasmid) [Rhodococcus sp. WAY2]|nr:hypothetical protein GFS60_07418 [Rhodococcus sp. WAY2]
MGPVSSCGHERSGAHHHQPPQPRKHLEACRGLASILILAFEVDPVPDSVERVADAVAPRVGIGCGATQGTPCGLVEIDYPGSHPRDQWAAADLVEDVDGNRVRRNAS